MSQVQQHSRRFFQHADFSDRDWIPRRCVKMSCIHRDYMRRLLRELIRARVNNLSPSVTITIDCEDFVYLTELLECLEQSRLIKSSVSQVTAYAASTREAGAKKGSGNSATKKNPQ